MPAPKPVKWKNKLFVSQQQLAGFLGVHKSVLSRWIASGRAVEDLTWKPRGAGKAVQDDDGVWWATSTALAAHLGISRQALSRRLAKRREKNDE